MSGILFNTSWFISKVEYFFFLKLLRFKNDSSFYKCHHWRTIRMILTGFVFTLAIVSVSLFISASKEPLLEWRDKGAIREYEMVDKSYEEKVFQMIVIYCFSFVQHMKIKKYLACWWFWSDITFIAKRKIRWNGN